MNERETSEVVSLFCILTPTSIVLRAPAEHRIRRPQ